MSSSGKFHNAPLRTIDVKALKASRFLDERKRLLPYRDAEGRVNVNLCEFSQKELAGMSQVARQALPDGTADKLKSWTRHSRMWADKEGARWTQHGSEWVSSLGERATDLEATPRLAAKGASDDRAEPRIQRAATEETNRVASRVGGSEAEQRRLRMAQIALSKGGRKRASDGEGSPGAAAGEQAKRSKADEAAREARDRKEAERLAERAARKERKAAAKAARRAAKAERRAAALANGEQQSEAEAEDQEEEDESDESGSEDDSEQVFEDTMAKCDKVASQMRKTLSALVKPDAAQSLPQPPNMSTEMQMAPHQLLGLSWLKGLHEQGASGILADEMGLGKTVQAIALLAQLMSEGERGPHVVVAPTSTLENWVREFGMWCPTMTVLKYHGSEPERADLRKELQRGRFDVVLCTFKLFEGTAEKNHAERKFLRKLGLRYLVIDEAQQIKNSESARYKNLAALKTPHRLLLTGTPIENSPRELLALLAFLMPSTFAAVTKKGSKHKDGASKGPLVQLFAALDRAGEGQELTATRARRIKQLMAPFVLRRLKDVVLHGLLPKTEEEMLVPMTAAQQALYATTVKSIAEQARARQLAWEEEARGEGAGTRGLEDAFGGEGRKWVRAAFVELRKVAQHGLLLRSRYSDLERIAYVLKCEEEFGEAATLDMVRAELRSASDLDVHRYCLRYPALRQQRLPPEALLEVSGKAARLAQLLPPLLAAGHRALVFSQWTSTLDLIELLLEQLQIRALRFDGSTPVHERQRLIDEYNGDESIGVFLLTTRAGGLGINLTAADTVIIHDADFNPAVDRQAMDRAHRMGQQRPVRVIKLASAATVDEQVLKIAASKLRQQSVLLSGGGKAGGKAAKGDEDAASSSEMHEDLMGGILRDLLHSQAEPAHAPAPAASDAAPAAAQEPPAAADPAAPEAAPAAPTPMDVEGAAEMDVAADPAEAEAEAEAEGAAEATAEAAAAAAAAETETDGPTGMEAEDAGAAAADAEQAQAAPSPAAVAAEPTEGQCGAVPAEAALREQIAARRERFLSGMTLREALDELDAHFGCDLRAAGLKPLVKNLAKQVVEDKE